MSQESDLDEPTAGPSQILCHNDPRYETVAAHTISIGRRAKNYDSP